MIPKVIHFVWVGPNQIPSECVNYIDGWKRAYEDYTVCVWSDADILQHRLIPECLQHAYNDDSMPYAFKADIARYCIINKFGGIYLDTDFQFLRKLPEPYLHNDFLGGIQNNGQVAIGFFAATSNTSLLNDVIDKLPHNIENSKNEGWYSGDCLYKISGPEFFDCVARNYFDKDRYVFFEPKHFYPYSWLEPHRRHEDFYATQPQAYAVHHWYKSWK